MKTETAHLRYKPSNKGHGAAGRAARHALLLVAYVLFLVPLISMVVGSLAAGLAPAARHRVAPNPLTLEQLSAPCSAWWNWALCPEYRRGRDLAVPVTLLVASWAGFALAQWTQRIARTGDRRLRFC